MAINSDIRLQYANNINKNIFGIKSANDNEDDFQALKLISTSLSSLNLVSSRIQSILKNQILLDRFEYKEKARIQKEINAESISNNAAVPVDAPSEGGINITPLMSVIGNMFDDLTQRVQNLAESASMACGEGGGLFGGSGTGSGGGTGGGRGSNWDFGGLSALGDIALSGLVLGAVGYGEDTAAPEVQHRATPGASASIDQTQMVTSDEAATVAAVAATATAAQLGTQSTISEAAEPAIRPTQAPQSAATAAVPEKGTVSKQGSDAGYKLAKSKDVKATAELTQKAKTSPAKQAKPKTPAVPKPKKAAAPKPPAAPVARPAAQAQRQPPTTTFNWPALFTGFIGGTAVAAAGAFVGKSIVTRAQEAIMGYNPLADTGGAQGEKIPQGDTAGYLSTLYNAFRSKGVTHEGAITMLAQIGRENGYQARFLFGVHTDPKNGALNIGMISWQGDRAVKLAKFLQARGVMKGNKIIPGDAALKAQVDFMMQEMSSGNYSPSLKALKDPNLKYAQIEGIIGDNYIRWARHDPIHRGPGYDNQNRWMRKARAMFDKPGQQTKPKTPYTEAKNTVSSIPQSLGKAASDFYNAVTSAGQAAVGEVKEFVTGRPKNLTFEAGADLTGMKPGFLKKFYSAVHDYGGPVRVTSAYRSDPYQAQLWVRANVFGERGVYGPARPKSTQTITYKGQQFTVKGSGTGSRHLMGLAVDISNSTNRAALDPYLRKYGLHRSDPRGDPPHVQEIGGPSMESGGSVDKPDPGAKNAKAAPNKPGWSLTLPRNDNSDRIQKSKIESFAKDKKGRTPFIIQNPPPSSPSIMMTPGKGPQAPRGRSRDVSADYKRGFGL